MTLDGGAVVASAAAPAAGGARRLTVKPSMLGYTRGISCRIASSRWRTMTYSRRKVADPKKSSVTMRHERCQEKIERSASAALEVEVDGKRNCSPLCCL